MLQWVICDYHLWCEVAHRGLLTDFSLMQEDIGHTAMYGNSLCRGVGATLAARIRLAGKRAVRKACGVVEALRPRRPFGHPPVGRMHKQMLRAGI